MIHRSGRAYVFVRWSGFSNDPGRLGEVAWAFENVDRLGRFVCFYCGAVGARPGWTDRCSTILELINTMVGDTAGYDEVKVFEVQAADPESALAAAQRIAEEPNRAINPIDVTRDVLFRYGVRGLALTRGFSAPFLWYNILPGRSVAIRKLPLHLFQLRSANELVSADDIEEQARQVALHVAGVLGLGECFVARIRTGYLVALKIAVNPHLTVGESHKISLVVEEAVSNANSRIRHTLVQVIPADI